jgi:hypothetical protein
MVPSRRVFRRESFDGTFYSLRYGRRRFRIRPVLWLSLPDEGIDVGGQVEVRGLALHAEPMIARVMHVLWNRPQRRIEYLLRSRGMRLHRPYIASELRLVTQFNPLSHRP